MYASFGLVLAFIFLSVISALNCIAALFEKENRMTFYKHSLGVSTAAILVAALLALSVNLLFCPSCGRQKAINVYQWNNSEIVCEKCGYHSAIDKEDLKYGFPTQYEIDKKYAAENGIDENVLENKRLKTTLVIGAISFILSGFMIPGEKEKEM